MVTDREVAQSPESFERSRFTLSRGKNSVNSTHKSTHNGVNHAENCMIGTSNNYDTPNDKAKKPAKQGSSYAVGIMHD
jgi:hypothetical protein